MKTAEETELITYNVKISTIDWDEILYTGHDHAKAKKEFDGAGLGDVEERHWNRNDLVVIFEREASTYKFVKQLDEYETIEDYPVEDFYHDPNVYKLIKEGDWQDVEVRDLKAINAKTDEILSDVQSHYGGKYTDVQLDKEGYKFLKLRIADHSGKWKNKGFVDYFLSIVIAEKDPTDNFYKQGPEGISSDEEFHFDSDYTSAQIIAFIDEKIQELKDEVAEQKTPTPMKTAEEIAAAIKAELANMAADANYENDDVENQIFDDIKALTGWEPDSDTHEQYAVFVKMTNSERLAYALTKLPGYENQNWVDFLPKNYNITPELQAEFNKLAAFVVKANERQVKTEIILAADTLAVFVKEHPQFYPQFFAQMLKLPKKYSFGFNPYSKFGEMPTVVRWLQDTNTNLFALVPVKKYDLPKYRPFDTTHEDKVFMKIHADFVGTDDLRPIMMGINFNEHGAVSTDAHVLIFTPYRSGQHKPYGNFCFTKKCFEQEQAVESGKYPQWQQVIPKNNPDKVAINVVALYNFLKNAIELQIVPEVGKGVAFTYQDQEGGKREIGFNTTLFLKALIGMVELGHKELEMSFSQPNRAALIYPAGQHGKIADLKTDFMLLMPIMLSGERADEDGAPNMQYNLESNCVKFTGSAAQYCFEGDLPKKQSFKLGETVAVNLGAGVVHEGEITAYHTGMPFDHQNGYKVQGIGDLLPAERLKLVKSQRQKLIEMENELFYLYAIYEDLEKEPEKQAELNVKIKALENDMYNLENGSYSDNYNKLKNATPISAQSPVDKAAITEAIELLTELLADTKGKKAKKEISEAIELLKELLIDEAA